MSPLTWSIANDAFAVFVVDDNDDKEVEETTVGTCRTCIFSDALRVIFSVIIFAFTSPQSFLFKNKRRKSYSKDYNFQTSYYLFLFLAAYGEIRNLLYN